MSTARTAKVQQQRARLLDGLAAAIREKGLARTHVSDIVGRARASRRTFYQHFPDKDSCLVELVHLSTTTIIDAVTAATDAQAPLGDRVAQAIDGYLSVLSSEPELTLALSSPSVGERIVRAQRDGLERFAGFLTALAAGFTDGQTTPVSVERSYLLASGLRATALRAIERGETLDQTRAEGKALFIAAFDTAAPPHDSPD